MRMVGSVGAADVACHVPTVFVALGGFFHQKIC